MASASWSPGAAGGFLGRLAAAQARKWAGGGLVWQPDHTSRSSLLAAHTQPWTHLAGRHPIPGSHARLQLVN